jgi:hypothetical protein
MLLLALGCSLPPASPAADSAAPEEHDSEETWDICWRSLEGDASGTYYVDSDVRGGCGGPITLWCDDDGIRGAADLACDGNLSSLTLVLEGVQVGSELGGRVAITGDDDTVLADWAADVATDLSVVGGFTTSDERIDGHYELWGAFAVGMPSSL